MKRLNAPKHWMLDKLGGAFVCTSLMIQICVFVLFHLFSFLLYVPVHALNIMIVQAPKPSSGPHKSRECLPLILILLNLVHETGGKNRATTKKKKERRKKK